MRPAGDILEDAALAISARGLCLTDYEDSTTGALDPAGAVAIVLGLPAHVWADHSALDLESEPYQDGWRALYLLVESRYDMRLPDGESWTGEALAQHVAFWLEHTRPSVAEVVDWLREVAAHYASKEVAA